MNYDYLAAKARRKELVELIAAAADEIAAIDAELKIGSLPCLESYEDSPLMMGTEIKN
jgi:hypothetical protein